MFTSFTFLWTITGVFSIHTLLLQMLNPRSWTIIIVMFFRWTFELMFRHCCRSSVLLLYTVLQVKIILCITRRPKVNVGKWNLYLICWRRQHWLPNIHGQSSVDYKSWHSGITASPKRWSILATLINNHLRNTRIWQNFFIDLRDCYVGNVGCIHVLNVWSMLPNRHN